MSVQMFLLIEPVWNWNELKETVNILRQAFNRTSLELKRWRVFFSIWLRQFF